MAMQQSQKYHGEQGDRYDGKMQWPGANGFPFLGDAPPSLKQHETEALPIVGHAHERLFDMNDEEEREYFNWVRDRIRNGLFVQDFIDRRFGDCDENRPWPIIYLEWTQCYVMSPPQASSGSSGHGSTTQFTLRRPRKA